MKRGVVVELDDDFVTLLTPDGQFLKATNKEGNYELGEEISFFPLLDKREEAATKAKRADRGSLFQHFSTRTARVGILSAVAIIFFITGFLPFFNNDEVYAYMSIDINPSFEVGVDNDLKVITLEPLNDEANDIMNSLKGWQEKPLNEIVQIIVEECKVDGYVYPGKEIIITTVMNETDVDIENELQDDLKKIRSAIEDEEMVVKTIESDQETREKAQEQGVSTGKYIELVEQKEETEEEVEDTTKSEATQAPAVPVVLEKKEPNIENEVKEAPSNQTVNNNSAQKEIKKETKEKLNEVKKKLKENGQKSHQNIIDNKKNNAKQTGNTKQEERKEIRNNRINDWKSLNDDPKDRDNGKKEQKPFQ